MTLSERQREMCEASEVDYSDLSALFLNCTLKPSPTTSHTRGLIDVSAAIMEANDVEVEILLIGSPIWLGERSSVASKAIERLYGSSGKLNDRGQYVYYDRVAGCILTGNEDGIKHCAMNILYALQHIGYTVPPQADAGWIGPAGPGPSYLDEDSGGPENEFTQRNTTFMTWNLLHLARMVKDGGGIPAHGNQRSEWEAGCRFDHPNPEHR